MNTYSSKYPYIIDQQAEQIKHLLRQRGKPDLISMHIHPWPVNVTVIDIFKIHQMIEDNVSINS